MEQGGVGGFKGSILWRLRLLRVWCGCARQQRCAHRQHARRCVRVKRKGLLCTLQATGMAVRRGPGPAAMLLEVAHAPLCVDAHARPCAGHSPSAVMAQASSSSARGSACAARLHGQRLPNGCGDGLRRRQGKGVNPDRSKGYSRSVLRPYVHARTRCSEGEGLPAQVQAVGMGARRGCVAVLTGKSGGRTFRRPTKLLTLPRTLSCREKAQGAAQAQALQAWLVLSLVPVVGQ